VQVESEVQAVVDIADRLGICPPGNRWPRSANPAGRVVSGHWPSDSLERVCMGPPRPQEVAEALPEVGGARAQGFRKGKKPGEPDTHEFVITPPPWGRIILKWPRASTTWRCCMRGEA